jgi:hypothetical protein
MTIGYASQTGQAPSLSMEGEDCPFENEANIFLRDIIFSKGRISNKSSCKVVDCIALVPIVDSLETTDRGISNNVQSQSKPEVDLLLIQNTKGTESTK